MGFLDKAVFGGGAVAAAAVVRHWYKDAQETKRRRGSPLDFTDGVSEVDFQRMATDVGRETPRVHHVEASGMTVRLHVKSNSGLSSWTAEVDFNDYGHLTGAYWLTTENNQSIIPEHFAEEIQRRIEATPHSGHQ